MGKNFTLDELIEFLSNCSGDEGIEFISEFQSGTITICDREAEPN